MKDDNGVEGGIAGAVNLRFSSLNATQYAYRLLSLHRLEYVCARDANVSGTIRKTRTGKNRKKMT